MQTIKINNARFYSFHGCMEEESRIGGEYYINVELSGEMDGSFIDDDISKTIDYVHVYSIISQEMQIRSKLIERVAFRIMNRIKEEIKLSKNCKLEIVKISPPIGGEVHSVAFIFSQDFDR